MESLKLILLSVAVTAALASCGTKTARVTPTEAPGATFGNVSTTNNGEIRDRNDDNTNDTVIDDARDAANDMGNTAGDAANDTGNAADDIGDAADNAITDAGETIGDAARGVGDTAGDIIDGAGDAVGMNDANGDGE